jgi:hypothetical protein
MATAKLSATFPSTFVHLNTPLSRNYLLLILIFRQVINNTLHDLHQFIR